jgi:hypothetical protein
MRIPLALIQLIPIVVLLLPLIEAIGLTVFWRRSLSSPWLYGLVGTLVAYAVAVGAVFVAEQYKPGRGTVITSSSPVWRDEAPLQNQAQRSKPAPIDNRPYFEPLTPSWFALLASVVVLCGLALWGLRFAFRSSTP